MINQIMELVTENNLISYQISFLNFMLLIRLLDPS